MLRYMEIKCGKEGMKKCSLATASCTLESLLGARPSQERKKKLASEEME
jgi:hypothetical protein